MIRFFHIPPKRWTQDQVELLKKHASLPISEIAKFFPDRSRTSIASKLYKVQPSPRPKESRLNRLMSFKKGFWTPAEDALLLERLKNADPSNRIPWASISEDLGRKYSTVRQRWMDVLGMEKSDRVMSEQKKTAILECLTQGNLKIREIATKFNCPAKKVYTLKYQLITMGLKDQVTSEELQELLSVIQGYLAKGFNFVPWVTLSAQFKIKPGVLKKSFYDYVVSSHTPKLLWDSKRDEKLMNLIQTKYENKGLPVDWQFISKQCNRTMLQVYFRYTVLKAGSARSIQMTSVPVDFSSFNKKNQGVHQGL